MMQKGKNIADIQEMNRSLVIRIIQRQVQTSRAEISKQTGLNQATVTNIINDFIKWGVVREVGLIAGSRGRRSIALELVSEKYMIIGIRLARKHFSVGVFDLSGKCYHEERFLVGLKDDIDYVLQEVCAQIRLVQKSYPEADILGIGVALPGPFIKSEGQIAILTETEGLQGVDIAKRLSEETGLKVYAEHDANAAVMAEWRYAQKYDSTVPLMCIMAGQGIGSGMMENGKLIAGAIGIAGEIGHMSIQYDGPVCGCGNRGCLEMFCSTISIQKRVQELLGAYPNSCCRADSSFSEILQAYKKEDPLARQVIHYAARYLGYGIVNIANTVNPGKIIIGDELSRAGTDFLRVVQETVKERLLPKVYENMEIALSDLEDAALVGTCMLVIEESLRAAEAFIKD